MVRRILRLMLKRLAIVRDHSSSKSINRMDTYESRMKFILWCLVLHLAGNLQGSGDGPCSSGQTYAQIWTQKEESVPPSSSGESLLQGTPGSIHLEQKWPLKQASGSTGCFRGDASYLSFMEKCSTLFAAAKALDLKAARGMAEALMAPRSGESVRQVENVEIFGQYGNKIPLRMYISKAGTALPVLVYFHSGGWVVGSVDSSDSICRSMANIFGAIVVSVEYRLAPEFPFPLEDCYAAVCWVADTIDTFGGDHANIIVCGEGAGANLAAAVTLLARDKQRPHIKAQVLLCPLLDALPVEDPSELMSDRLFPDSEVMNWLWKMYLKSPGDAGNPYACPGQERNFDSLPPAVIMTAEGDPLSWQGEQYARSLEASGIAVVARGVPGACHSFLSLPLYDEHQKNQWLGEVKQLIKKVLTESDYKERAEPGRSFPHNFEK